MSFHEMKISKRDGRVVDFNYEKIKNAVKKASASVSIEHQIPEDVIESIVENVVNKCMEHTSIISVEEVQDLVEREIMASDHYEVAKSYITYRYTHNLIRQKNTTDDKILSIVDLVSQEAKEENSNKNPVINSTQRDYMAGEVSRDLTERVLLPKDVVDAHKLGIIHFHDSDYFVNRSFNCFSGDTKFITDTGIRQFKSFRDGEYVYVKDYLGVTRLAQVHTYGIQKFQKVTLRNPLMRKTFTCTADHRWVLDTGEVTTNLKVGDVLAPTIGNFGFSIDNIDEAKAFCIGFVVGDGTDNNRINSSGNANHRTVVRLCGDKTKYANIFTTAGYRISQVKDSDDLYAYISGVSLKQNFLDGRAWRYMTPKMKELVFKGFYAADGASRANKVTTSDDRVCEMIEEISGIAGYYISSKSTIVHDTNFKTDAILHQYHFIVQTHNNWKWRVESIERAHSGLAYCVEEPVTHTFTLECGIVTGNCDLVNLEDMLQNGTVITGTLIEKPHSFSTACNITTQIIAQVASNQYGGQSITLTHLAPFVDVSRKKIRKIVEGEMIKVKESTGTVVDEITINEMVEARLRDEIKKGIQTIQYQVVTLLTTNGQAPFITVFMYLGETDDPQTKNDLAMIIEETLLQRIQGVKNESGVWVTPAFPKLIYVLEEDNIHPDSKYYYLTELAAKCTAKRMVPDYISEKVMKEFKNGDVYPCINKPVPCIGDNTSKPA